MIGRISAQMRWAPSTNSRFTRTNRLLEHSQTNEKQENSTKTLKPLLKVHTYIFSMNMTIQPTIRIISSLNMLAYKFSRCSTHKWFVTNSAVNYAPNLKVHENFTEIYKSSTCSKVSAVADFENCRPMFVAPKALLNTQRHKKTSLIGRCFIELHIPVTRFSVLFISILAEICQTFPVYIH